MVKLPGIVHCERDTTLRFAADLARAHLFDADGDTLDRRPTTTIAAEQRDRPIRAVAVPLANIDPKARATHQRATNESDMHSPRDWNDRHDRYRMIAEAASFRAEKRGFALGDEELAWMQAEEDLMREMEGGEHVSEDDRSEP